MQTIKQNRLELEQALYNSTQLGYRSNINGTKYIMILSDVGTVLKTVDSFSINELNTLLKQRLNK